MSAARRVKKRLLQMVLSQGPFLFEDGSCFFIDVDSFDMDSWQWMKLPVWDVTDRAQGVFEADFLRDRPMWRKLVGCIRGK